MSSGRRRDWRTIYLAPNGTQLFQDVDWYAGDVDDLVTHKHMHIESINSYLAHVHTRTHGVCVRVCVIVCTSMVMFLLISVLIRRLDGHTI